MTYLSKHIDPLDYSDCVTEFDRICERFRWWSAARRLGAQFPDLEVDLYAQSDESEVVDKRFRDMQHLIALVERLQTTLNEGLK